MVFRSAEQARNGLLFFNIQHIKAPKGFVTMGGDSHPLQLFNMLKKGGKINYQPNRKQLMKNAEIAYLLEFIQEKKKKEDGIIDIIADEVHLYNATATNGLKELATTGLEWGLPLTVISQRPALVDNTLLSQSNEWYFFHLPNEDRKWMKDYALPMEIMEKIGGNSYHYVKYTDYNNSLTLFKPVKKI